LSEGIFTISLDFELAWGVCGDKARASYRENLLGARTAIPALLELFKKYEIHATWATVGFLHFETKTELLQYLPNKIPQYANPDVSTYQQLNNVGTNEHWDPLHFAPSLVQLIRSYPFQELGTHTFSHYFCLEEGQDAEAFAADLGAAKKLMWDKYGEIPKSLVLPRNQINEEYLPLCRQYGVMAYRGNPRYSENSAAQKKLGQWLYDPTQDGERLAMRFFRLLDGYFCLTGHHTYTLSEIANREHLPNIRASSFLQPYRRPLKLFEPLRINRFKSGLTFAAKNGSIYHLWFHPHNFGKNLNENLNCLQAILEHYRQLKKKHNFKSLNMGEISDLIS